MVLEAEVSDGDGIFSLPSLEVAWTDHTSTLGKVCIHMLRGSFRKQISGWAERIFERIVVPERPQPIIK